MAFGTQGVPHHVVYIYSYVLSFALRAAPVVCNELSVTVCGGCADDEPGKSIKERVLLNLYLRYVHGLFVAQSIGESVLPNVVAYSSNAYILSEAACLVVWVYAAVETAGRISGP